MPRYSTRIPKYRLHKPSGQAVVTLNGRDVYLGKHGSPESKAEYNRLVAEWQLNQHRTPASSDQSRRTIDEVIARYTAHAQDYYRKPDGRQTSEVNTLFQALRPLHELYGPTDADAFGAVAFKTVRQAMIERGWCRRYINQQCSRIKQMFKWAAENEFVTAEVHHRLHCVSGLRKGRSSARESEPVRPVPDAHVEAVLKHVAPPVAAMIELQRFTGMRPDEVVRMRLCDIDRTEKVWIYVPISHKTEHHGKQRQIFIGPKAQRTLLPYLRQHPDEFLFSAAVAESNRLDARHRRRITPMSCGNRPGSNRESKRQRPPGDCYTVASYRRAIDRGCEKAFPPPEHLARIKVPGKKGQRWETNTEWRKRLGEKKWQELKAWRKAHQWSPNQLRHNAATELRKQFGIEAARVVLGHSSAIVTEIYAEMDFEKAKAIMGKVG